MIGVVVVHYEDPDGLRRVLDALKGSGDVSVVVADDGSATLPQVGERPYPVQVVRQEDRGFRAAAARNLGARTMLATSTDVEALLFLDGDTIPAPDYVAAIVTTLQRLSATSAHGRALVVGRRRYADLTGLTADDLASFLARPEPGRILPDTTWLDEGYAATGNLSRADDTSYRFVISSVLAVTPDLFEATGGFDENFVGYGGEDWDFAYRAWLAGADLAHEPVAVAWHDGPDAAGRDQKSLEGGGDRAAIVARKTAETIRLAHAIPSPGARDPGLIWEHPDVVVDLDDHDLQPVDVLLTCADLLRGTDARVWLREGAVLRDRLWPSGDPRVLLGPPPATSLARARYHVTIDRPVRLLRPLRDLCAEAPRHHPGLLVQRTRDRSRGLPPPPPHPDPAVRSARPDAHLEAEWGWRRADTLPMATSPRSEERP